MNQIVETKDPDVAASYELILWEQLVREAFRSAAYVIDQIVRDPRNVAGLYYVCTKAGITGRYYPAWPRVADESVNDGTATFIAKDPADVSPPVLSSIVWTVQSGLTLDSQSETEHVAQMTVSGGVAGTDYEATARITPSVGVPIDVTIIIPVRHT